MTPTIYLLLSLCLFFFITTCIYGIYCNQRKVKLAHEDFLEEEVAAFILSLEEHFHYHFGIHLQVSIQGIVSGASGRYYF